MPANTFRMLICGPSGSGKTNTLLNMLYRLLVYDKIYLYTKNLHQDKYQYMLDDFEKRVNPVAGYNVIEAGNDVIPLEMLPTDNQKIVIFDDLVCESSQRDDIINYFMTGRPRNCSAHLSYLKATLRPPKTSEIIVLTSVFLTFTPEKITVLLMNWGLTESCLKGLPTKNTLFYITTDQKNRHSKILMKIYRRMGYINGATGATQTHEATGSIQGEPGPAGPTGATWSCRP